MGQLIDGVWHTGWYQPDSQGAFHRPLTKYRGWLGADGSAAYPAAPGRYRIYASYACPWAHRTLITRALRGLEDAVAVTIVDPKMGDDGWIFPEGEPESLYGLTLLRELYLRADPRFTGRVTVPVLWDEHAHTIVNNESREIMRMLDTALEPWATGAPTLAPPDRRGDIERTLDAIYGPINDGVYRAGFAGSQGAYEEACSSLFAALDEWDAVLSRQRYLCGDTLTEADVALFTTLLRFDVVYYAHFKCNVRRIQDYPNLSGYLRDIYQVPGVRETCRFDQIKTHYYWSQTTVNPTRIVPLGPTLDLDAPHGRASIGG